VNNKPTHKTNTGQVEMFLTCPLKEVLLCAYTHPCTLHGQAVVRTGVLKDNLTREELTAARIFCLLSLIQP
jgi:hypothetical protein